MKNFGNTKSLRIKDLYESGEYSKELLEDLMAGKYKTLNGLSITDRANQDFMEPLLYAVKNELGTYEVYTYYAENLQNNLALAAEIIETEPELIEGTPISKNKQFIINYAEKNPEIIKYMSPALKNDIDVIEEICRTGNENAISAIVQDTVLAATILSNPELSSNKEFMSNAIEKSGQAIALASEELKNDYDFLRDAYKTNMEAIDYTAQHTEEFGEKGLLAAKEVIIETSSDNAIKEFEDERKKVQEELERKKEESPDIDDETVKKLELDEKKFQRHIRFIQKIQNGEVDQVRAARLINSICKDLEPEYKKRIEQMLTIDTAMKEKQKEGLQKLTKEDIGEVARDLKKMEGQLPQEEIEGLKKAIEEPIIEEKKEHEDDTPEQT